MIYIFVLMIVSGVIAYIGDAIGSAVGKKRLSVFGLRPRHTALIVAISTGMMITLFTVAVSYVWSENVQIALFSIENLRKETETLRTDKKVLSREKLDLESDKSALIREVAALGEDKNSLESDKLKLEEEKKALASDVEELTFRVRLKETESIAFRKGEPLSHILIKSGADVTEVMKQLTTFIISLADIARKKRVRVTNEINFFSENKDQLSAMAKLIADSQRDMVVGAVAEENMISGEDMGDVRFMLLPNILIFKANQAIAALELDGTKGRVEIARKLQSFMEALNHEVVSLGMIQNPLTGRFGVMSYKSMISFFDMVGRIKSTNRVVKLTAYAAKDTYSVGPLNILFKFDETGENIFTTIDSPEDIPEEEGVK